MAARWRCGFATSSVSNAADHLPDEAAAVVLPRTIGPRAKMTLSGQESEALLHAILDNTPAVVYLKDLEGRYLFVNRRFQELTGRTREEMIGKTVFDVTRRDLAEIAEGQRQRVLTSSGPVDFEETVIY